MGTFCAQILARDAFLMPRAGKWFYPATILCILACQPNAGRADDVPAIEDFVVVHLGGNEWEATGQVVDSEPGGLYVFFWGAVSGLAVTDEDGAFSFSFTFDPMGGGLIEAEVGNHQGAFGSAEAYISNS